MPTIRILLATALTLASHAAASNPGVSLPFATSPNEASFVRSHVVIKLKAQSASRALASVDGPNALSQVARHLNLPQGAELAETHLAELLHRQSQGKQTPTTAREPDFSRHLLLRIPPGLTVPECVEQLKDHPWVEYIEPDWTGAPRGRIPNDPHFAGQWHLRNLAYTNGPVRADIHALEAWELTRGSSNVVVAVLDSGLNMTLPEFAGRLVPGYDFVNKDSDPTDDLGHGTIVSSILCANANDGSLIAGVDQQCRLMPVKVFGPIGGEPLSLWADAIDWAVLNGCKVINMSIGTYNTSTPLLTSITNAIHRGVSIVVASDNLGLNRPDDFLPSIPGVITVGATDGSDRRATFSNFGPLIDLMAPGFYIPAVSRFGGVWNVSGTSFATPMVTAAASLMAAVRPSITPQETLAYLCAGADDQVGDAWDTPGFDGFYSWGRLNAYNAVRLAQIGSQDLEIPALRRLLQEDRANPAAGPGPSPQEVLHTPLVSRWQSPWHTRDVNAVAYSPDGAWLASGSDDSMVKIWQVANGVLVRTLTGHLHGVLAVAFSPDGSRIASGSADNTIRLWRAADGTHLATLRGHGNWISAMAFSPDRETLSSASHDGTLKIWSITNGELRRTLTGHSGFVTSVAFSKDGSRMASGGADGTAIVWRMSNGTIERTLRGHTKTVNAVAFALDREQLATGSEDHQIKLWDAASGQMLQTLSGHTDAVTALAFSADGATLLSSSADRTMRVARIVGGAIFSRLFMEQGIVRAVAFSPGSTDFAAAGLDNALRIWNTDSGRLVQEMGGHQDHVLSTAFSRDGTTVATGSFDKTIKLWRADNGALLRTLPGHENWVQQASFSPDGRTLISGGGRDTFVRLWRADDGALLNALPGHFDWINAAVYSPDGSIFATGSYDGSIKLWRASDNRLLRNLLGHDSFVFSLVFSPDGTLLASGGVDNTVRIWRVSDRSLIHTLRGHQGLVRYVAIAPDNRMVGSASDDHTVRLWRLPEGTLFRTLEGHIGGVSSVDFDSSGMTLLSAGSSLTDPTIKFWRVSDGALLQTSHPAPSLAVGTWSARFSPEGDALSFGRTDGLTAVARNPYAPIRIREIVRSGNQIEVKWIGNLPPYQLQRRTDLRNGAWENIGPATTETSIRLPSERPVEFYRVVTP